MTVVHPCGTSGAGPRAPVALPVVPTSTLRLAVDAVDALESDLVALRRELHAHPELAWQETRTTALVAERLEKAGLGPAAAEVRPDRRARRRRRAARRAPRRPRRAPGRRPGGEPWASTVEGVAHACGHDVHTSALVGAGIALAAAHEQARCPAASGCCSSRPRR